VDPREPEPDHAGRLIDESRQPVGPVGEQHRIFKTTGRMPCSGMPGLSLIA